MRGSPGATNPDPEPAAVEVIWQNVLDPARVSKIHCIQYVGAFDSELRIVAFSHAEGSGPILTVTYPGPSMLPAPRLPRVPVAGSPNAEALR